MKPREPLVALMAAVFTMAALDPATTSTMVSSAADYDARADDWIDQVGH